jgi:hypothetical protein
VIAGRRAVSELLQGTWCAASSRAPGFQVAVPGECGEAARALGTAVAHTRHRALKAWTSASRAAREAAVTR